MHTLDRKLFGWPALVVAALWLAGCGGPLGPFAGGELSGVSAEPPASWRHVPETIQLEVRPQAPYSVNVWSIGIGPHLYVATGKEGSSWLRYLQADANVRVRLDGMIYALRAVEVRQSEERKRVIAAYQSKYGGADDDDSPGPIRARRQQAMDDALADEGGVIYRLQPRTLPSPKLPDPSPDNHAKR